MTRYDLNCKNIPNLYDVKHSKNAKVLKKRFGMLYKYISGVYVDEGVDLSADEGVPAIVVLGLIGYALLPEHLRYRGEDINL